MVEAASQGWADIATKRLEALEEAQEEIEKLRSSLENADRLILTRNQEIEKLRSDLAAANAEIENLENQLEDLFEEPTAHEVEIQNLKSEIQKLNLQLAERSPAQTEKSPPTGKDLSEVEPADLLNHLKAKRKKSKADLADVEAILELLEGEDG